MKLLIALLLPVTYGLSSSLFHDYQIKRLKPNWISIKDEGGSRNVTVDYEHRSQVFNNQFFWWVNGKLITDGDHSFRVRHLNLRRDSGYIDDTIKRASILVPNGFPVHTLKLQLVTEVFDIIIEVNVVPPGPRGSILEYIPDYSLDMVPKDEITYESGDELRFKTTFTTPGLERFTYDEMQAEFISMAQCTTLTLLEKRTSDRDGDFLTVYTPAIAELQYRDYIRSFNPDNKMLRLTVTTTSTTPPRGILKVKTGCRSGPSCQIFGGVSITRSAFLKPPPHVHGVFFPQDSVAFHNVKSFYDAEYGSDLDVTITAIGGNLTIDEDWDVDALDSPEILLYKKGRV